MQMFTKLTSDSKALNQYVTSALTAYQSSGERLHIAVCAAMHSSMTSGNPDVLTRIYHGLRSNDQVAMRQYLRRVSICIGLGVSKIPDGEMADVINAAAETGKVLDFKDKEFKVVPVSVNPNATKNRKACISLIEGPMVNLSDGWLRVFERNNFAEVKLLGDAQILESIKKLYTEATTETNKRKLQVSPAVKAMLSKFNDMAEQMLTQTELKDQDNTPKIKAKATKASKAVVAEAQETAMH